MILIKEIYMTINEQIEKINKKVISLLNNKDIKEKKINSKLN